MKPIRLLNRFLIWRIRHISTKNWLIVLGALVGVLGGFAAVILKSTVHFLQEFLEHQELGYGFVILPAIGILLSGFLAKHVLKERLGHGITSILYYISKRSSIISRVKTYSRMITSAITVGFGG